MRVEDRTGVMTSAEDRDIPRIILICEDETESQLVDKLGKPGDRVSGSLQLADGYGEFYIRLEPQVTPKPTEFTKKMRERCGSYADSGSVSHIVTAFMKTCELLDYQTSVIQEVIELMDEEPAKEILKKAVGGTK